MRSFFFRYVIQSRHLPMANTVPRVVVIVDQQEARARQRLMVMHPNAFVVKVDQTPFEMDCTPSSHPSRQMG